MYNSQRKTHVILNNTAHVIKEAGLTYCGDTYLPEIEALTNAELHKLEVDKNYRKRRKNKIRSCVTCNTIRIAEFVRLVNGK